MTFKNFSVEDQTIMLECMTAILTGPYIDDEEFRTRLGIERTELAEVIAKFPDVDESLDNSIANVAVNNCMNEIANGLDIPASEWNTQFHFSKYQVRRAYNRWREIKGQT